MLVSQLEIRNAALSQWCESRAGSVGTHYGESFEQLVSKNQLKCL